MRGRDFSRYADLPIHNFGDVDAFIRSGITAGVLSVTYNNAPIDFLAEFRGSATTLVTFNSALTSRQVTLPVFSARDTARSAGVNLIAVSDPSVALGVDLAWYLGSRGQGPIRPTISMVVKHLLGAFGSRRTILFGSSGGGYAAAYYAPDFPGSVALILNPRLDLSARPVSAMSQYLSACHKSNRPPNRIRADYVPERVADTYKGVMQHHVAIIQNTGDRLYREYQTDPFLQELAHTGKVFVQYGDWGDGHTPIPKGVVMEAVTLLADDSLPVASVLGGPPFQRPTQQAR